jgi:hypothetical protein
MNLNLIIDAHAAVADIHPIHIHVVTRELDQAAVLSVSSGANCPAVYFPQGRPGGIEMLGVNIVVGGVAVAQIIPDHIAAARSVGRHTRPDLSKLGHAQLDARGSPKDIARGVDFLGKKIGVLIVEPVIFPDNNSPVVTGGNDAGV